MEPLSTLTGSMVPLDRADVDTDQIMPKQFLKRVERTGFGEFVFFDWRREPDFVFNNRAYATGTILVAGPNFGAGSSREHAPWGLQQYGFRAIIAPSFGDIFAANCAKIGLLTVELPIEVCNTLMRTAETRPSAEVIIELGSAQVQCGDLVVPFEIEPHRLTMLTRGLDEIELTLSRAHEIESFEADRPGWSPVTTR